MRKFELHLDALIAIIVVFVLVVGFLLHQRHQYSVLLQANIDLAWEQAHLEVNYEHTTALLDSCRSEKKAAELKTEKELTGLME